MIPAPVTAGKNIKNAAAGNRWMGFTFLLINILNGQTQICLGIGKENLSIFYQFNQG
jgi:hypothetical protein